MYLKSFRIWFLLTPVYCGQTFWVLSESGEGIWFPLHHAVWNSCSESGSVTRHRVKACKMVDTLKRCDLASQTSKSWCSQVLLVTSKWYWGLQMMRWFVLEKVCILLLWRIKYRTAAFGGSNPWTKLCMEQCEKEYLCSVQSLLVIFFFFAESSG